MQVPLENSIALFIQFLKKNCDAEFQINVVNFRKILKQYFINKFDNDLEKDLTKIVFIGFSYFNEKEKNDSIILTARLLNEHGRTELMFDNINSLSQFIHYFKNQILMVLKNKKAEKIMGIPFDSNEMQGIVQILENNVDMSIYELYKPLLMYMSLKQGENELVKYSNIVSDPGGMNNKQDILRYSLVSLSVKTNFQIKSLDCSFIPKVERAFLWQPSALECFTCPAELKSLFEKYLITDGEITVIKKQMLPNEYAILSTSKDCAYKNKSHIGFTFFVVNTETKTISYACSSFNCVPSQLIYLTGIDTEIFAQIDKLFCRKNTVQTMQRSN